MHFFVSKEWKGAQGDIVPLAIAKAFSINIIIILPNNVHKHITILPHGGGFIELYIIILLQHDHYRAMYLSSSHPGFINGSSVAHDTRCYWWSAPAMSLLHHPPLPHCQHHTRCHWWSAPSLSMLRCLWQHASGHLLQSCSLILLMLEALKI